MSSWTGFGSACTDPVAEASPARGQSSVGQRNPAASMSRKDRSPVGNVGGAGSREPLQGLDGVCRRVSRGSARSLAHGAVRVPQTGCGDAAEGVICSVVVHTRLFDGAKIHFSSYTGKVVFVSNLQFPAHRGKARLLGGGSAIG